MKSIHSEEELRTAVEMVVGGPLSAEQERRFRDAVAWVENPRRGRLTLDTADEVLCYLDGGHVFLADFRGGPGLCYREGGGLCAYLRPGLKEEMEAAGQIGQGRLVAAFRAAYG